MRRPTIADLVADPTVRQTVYRIFIRDLEVDGHGGRPLLVSIDVVADRPRDPAADRYRNVVCYDTLVKSAKALAADPALPSIAALADGIADRSFADARVRRTAVRVVPQDSGQAGDAGIETVRSRAEASRRGSASRLRVVGA